MKHDLEDAYDKFDEENEKYPLDEAVENYLRSEIKYAKEPTVDWEEDDERLKKVVPKLFKKYMA